MKYILLLLIVFTLNADEHEPFTCDSRSFLFLGNSDFEEDGHVTSLQSNNSQKIGITTISTTTPFSNGRITDVQTFNTTPTKKETIESTITINSSPWLQHKSQYDIKMKTTSTLSGTGRTGRLIKTTKKVEKNRKMSW